MVHLLRLGFYELFQFLRHTARLWLLRNGAPEMGDGGFAKTPHADYIRLAEQRLAGYLYPAIKLATD
jgi:hypothetical protein